jgi:signal peptidase II
MKKILKKLDKKQFLYLATVTFPIFIIDQLTKLWAISACKNNNITIINNYWNFIYAENRGALFGLGNGFSESMRILIFVFFSSLITLLIFYLMFFKKPSKLLSITYALVLGGALGNLLDRAFRGFVVDFIDWHYKSVYHWPTFNFADAAIVVAIIFLGIEVLFLSEKEQKKETEN